MLHSFILPTCWRVSMCAIVGLWIIVRLPSLSAFSLPFYLLNCFMHVVYHRKILLLYFFRNFLYKAHVTGERIWLNIRDTCLNSFFMHCLGLPKTVHILVLVFRSIEKAMFFFAWWIDNSTICTQYSYTALCVYSTFAFFGRKSMTCHKILSLLWPAELSHAVRNGIPTTYAQNFAILRVISKCIYPCAFIFLQEVLFLPC